MNDAITTNRGYIGAALVHVDALSTRGVVPLHSGVRRILRAASLSQIGDTVVQSVSVDMVDIGSREDTMMDGPCKPVRQIMAPVDHHNQIPIVRDRAGHAANSLCVPCFIGVRQTKLCLPSKTASLSAIGKPIPEILRRRVTHG